MKLSLLRLLVLLSVAISFQEVAFGDTIDLTTYGSVVAGKRNEGWWSLTQSHDPSNYIYLTGNAGPIGGPYAQYRSSFTFNLSGLAGNVVSAQLELTRFTSVGRETTDRNGVPINDINSGVIQQLTVYDVSTDPTVLNTVSGISTSIYNDLGSGTVYGTYSEAQSWNPDGDVILNLNAAALQAINQTNGAISFGLTLNADGSQNDYMFGGTGGAYNGDQVLILNTAPAPEPAAAGLALLGAFVCLSFSRRRGTGSMLDT